MSAKPPTRQTLRAPPGAARGAAAATEEKRGSLRWVGNFLGRAIRPGQGRGQAPNASADPRRGTLAAAPLSLLMQQRADLGARLLVHDPATQRVRNLLVIHDELGSRGWPGVEALPAQIVDRALTEAEILSSQETSNLLSSIIEGLRAIKDAAGARAIEAARAASEREWAILEVPEVSEANYDEYELMERSWVGTVPAGL